MVEKILVATLVMMGIIAFVMELPFYTTHPAWWKGAADDPTSLIRRVWSIYEQWDPIFNHPPLWLRVMCWIEVVLFGPLYFVSAFAVATRSPRLLRGVVAPFAGALVYSTIVYFALELAPESRVEGTNDVMVLLINAPWTVIGAVLMWYVWTAETRRKRD